MNILFINVLIYLTITIKIMMAGSLGPKQSFAQLPPLDQLAKIKIRATPSSPLPVPNQIPSQVQTQLPSQVQRPTETLCLVKNNHLSIQEVMSKSNLSEGEIFKRLVFVEGISTNFAKFPQCQQQADLIFQSIAWGVMNRVQLAASSPRWSKSFGRGMTGVIFKKGQFNPATSLKSQYSQFFLCPNQHPLWSQWEARLGEIIELVTKHPEKNPLPSLAANFYYPLSNQATKTPPAWADPQKNAANFQSLVLIDGKKLNIECVRFFTIN